MYSIFNFSSNIQIVAEGQLLLYFVKLLNFKGSGVLEEVVTGLQAKSSSLELSLVIRKTFCSKPKTLQ